MESSFKLTTFDSYRHLFRLLAQEKLLQGRRKLDDKAYPNKRLVEAVETLNDWYQALGATA